MARQEIILGTPPQGIGGDTPRAANMKINAMTQELYQGFDTTNKTGWGKSDAVRLPDGTNMNNLPYINAIYTLTGTNNTNVPEGTQNGHIMVQCADIFVRQTFRQMGANVTWERGGQQGGGWSAWARLAQVGGNMGNGIAGANLYNGNVDMLFAAAPVGFSTYQLGPQATGVNPPGFTGSDAFNGSVLEITKWGSDWGYQKLSGGTGGTGGSQGGIFARTITGGSYSGWQLQLNILNMLNPVDNANGRVGAMDDRSIGSWRVSRFANGLMVMSSPLANKTVGSNQAADYSFTTPVATPDWGKTLITVHVSPTSSGDHYGVISALMTSPTAGQFTIRNGATSQEFWAIRIAVTGYWK